MTTTTYIDWFASRPAQDKLAVVDDNGCELTFGQLRDFIGQFEQAYATVSPRDEGRLVAFLSCTNTTGSVAGYLACLATGVVPLMAGSFIKGQEWRDLLAAYEPDLLWLPTDAFDDLSTDDYTNCFESYGYCLMIRQLRKQTSLFDKLALLVPTSGSTGGVKYVRQSYDNIIENARSIIEYLDIDPLERAFVFLPMHYVFGLSIINTHILAGGSIVLTETGAHQKYFWENLAHWQATSLSGVPYNFALFKRIGWERRVPESLKTLTQAGGPLPEDLQIHFADLAEKTGRRLFLMYGQAEATARMAYLPPHKVGKKIGCIGQAIPRGSLELIDEEGRVINQANEVGEIVYRGPNVTLGYAHCRGDLVHGDENGGVLKTGDVAYRDSSGDYYITGRTCRFVKLCGNRVSLDDVERKVYAAYPNLSCACCGADDNLIVCITDEEKVSEVRMLLTRSMHINKRLITVGSVEALPRTAAGKVAYPLIEAELQGRA